MRPGEPPIVVVEGEVSDLSASTVTLVANGERRAVPVIDGRFRQVLPTMEPTTRVWAEVSQNGAPWRSSVVTVGREAVTVPAALVLLEASDEITRTAELVVTWRRRPDRLEGTRRSVQANVVRDPSRVGAFVAFYLSSLTDGVYSLVLKTPAPVPSSVRPKIYLHSADGVRLRAVEAPESGAGVLARMLLPQGAFWEDDDWFTGRSESVEAITKFRFPDGVSWIERKR